jgi:hypothetical protein
MQLLNGTSSMGTTTADWRELFAAWPADMPRRAVVVTAMNEQIPFSEFQMGEAFLLLERAMPDSLGARMVVVPYEQIVALKLTEVVQSKSLRSLGFGKSAAAP